MSVHRFPASATLSPEQMIETMTALADEAIAAEARIKDLLLEAIDRGDYERATEIARRWKVEAPVELLHSLEGGR
jgi:hypothetical protein